MEQIARRKAYLAFNLIQDVAVLRPVALIAAQDVGLSVELLISSRLIGRDPKGDWQAEIAQLGEEIGAPVRVFRSTWEGVSLMKAPGVLVTASESNLPEHRETHQLVKSAPAHISTLLIQHGLESVGVSHNRAHDRAHGQSVTFASDLLAVWQPVERLEAMVPSQRPKAVLAGPPSRLMHFPHRAQPERPVGLICENLHSVRLKQEEHVQIEFIEALGRYFSAASTANYKLFLRPHPAGQFAVRNKVPLPDHVELLNGPIHRVDLRQFAFGISAPSSVLLDLVFADVPIAVWRGTDGHIDCRHYEGLAHVGSAEEMQEFAAKAIADPEPFRRSQQEWLAELEMPTDPQDIARSYANLMNASSRLGGLATNARPLARHRVLIVANAYLPTVQVCLEQPLSEPSGVPVAMVAILEEQMKYLSSANPAERAHLLTILDLFAPTAIIMSRYTGPNGRVLADWARKRGIPQIFHLDDDLFAVPDMLGAGKSGYHNHPDRQSSLRENIARADLVYASNDVLAARIREETSARQVVVGEINCSASIMQRPDRALPFVLGYTATPDHAANLEMVLPAIIRLMDARPSVRFELFGSIQIPSALERFKERVVRVESEPEYSRFLEKLATRRWGIGICPLVDHAFNRSKSVNKWVEYTAVGAATVASANSIYEQCCAEGAGLLVAGDDQWFDAFIGLIDNADRRLALASNAQMQLEQRYRPEDHKNQVLNIIAEASGNAVGQVSGKSFA